MGNKGNTHQEVSMSWEQFVGIFGTEVVWNGSLVSILDYLGYLAFIGYVA